MVTKPKAPPTTAPAKKEAESPVAAVAPIVASSQPTPATTESSLATGPEYEVAVQNLCDMGFDREQVKQAMVTKNKLSLIKACCIQ